MNNNLNETALARILNLIPENIKPVNFFMDVLDLGKESAYRRLRGEKALSFEEIYKLSLELGFSLDEVVENSKANSFLFNHIGTYGQKPEENFLEFLYYYEDYLNRLIKADCSEVICTMNHILSTMIVRYENLFKFVYYRWMHQVKEVPFNFFYADVAIPAEVKELCSRLGVLHRKLKKLTFIIDDNLHLNIIREMQYFYKRNLITGEELTALKEEYLRYMDYTETIIKKGTDSNGTIFEIYLSTFNISTTTTYSAWDNNEESSFWHFYGYPIFTRNKKITSRHKYWINSLKKYATVISQSNEFLQADFFNRQRSYVNRMTDNVML